MFEVSEYRKFIKFKIEQDGRRGLISRLAESAECQRSHLSRVLKGQLHLTLEQAFRITRFFPLSVEEQKYFMKMVEFERSGDVAYRTSIKVELADLKQQYENISNRVQQNSIGQQEKERIYYANWFWSAIHIIVSIPKYQNIKAISQRLNLSEEIVTSCLRQLKDFGLVQNEKDRWFILSGGIHLSKDSPLNSVQHSNWRDRAVISTQNPKEDGVHYTVVQSVSREDYDSLKQVMLKSIDEFVKIASPSREEELVCFTCDFFKV